MRAASACVSTPPKKRCVCRVFIFKAPGSSPGQPMAKPGQADAACAKRGKRRVLFAASGLCYSRATRRGTSHPLNCRRFQPSQSTDPNRPALALGSPVGVGIEGLVGEVESSCSHPREAEGRAGTEGCVFAGCLGEKDEWGE